jgi:hypothetical protein
MTLRKGHGTGAGVPRVEVMPADELPAPVPAVASEPARPVRRRQDGKLADVESAKALGRLGGEAKARRVRLVDSLGLSKVVEQTTFGPYRAAAEEFVAHHRVALAHQAGGELGPAPSTMVASAGLQLAASRWAFDQGAAQNDAALIKLGSALANDSRQNLLAAYELATREAQARSPVDAGAALVAALAAEEPSR